VGVWVIAGVCVCNEVVMGPFIIFSSWDPTFTIWLELKLNHLACNLKGTLITNANKIRNAARKRNKPSTNNICEYWENS